MSASTDPARPMPSDEGDRPPLLRPQQGRWLAGVCRGLATHLQVPVTLVRAVIAGLSLFGPGVVVYGFLWLTMVEGEHGESLFERRGRVRRTTWVVALVLLALGAAASAVISRSIDLGAILPMLAIAAGLVLTWSLLDRRRRATWFGGAAITTRESWLRVLIGAGLVFGGILVLASGERGIGGLRDVLLATVVVLVGASLLLVPFGIRLWEDFRAEQTERIRATEKADIAAHLHDSVLQTLALIQRRADDPVAVRRLARGQERELRGWLFAQDPPEQETMVAATRAMIQQIEDQLGRPVEFVSTGDTPLDEDGAAMVRALGEAVSNAIRHGAPPVSVYLEVGPRETEAFVRDHGAGFDPDAVAKDRRGVRQSIIGRMERHGGRAQVRRREPGTEVSLSLPRHDRTTPTAHPNGQPPAAVSAGGSATKENTDER